MSLAAPRPQDRAVICSAKGCKAEAAYGLLWNNPKLHTPERRKAWMACQEHAGSLAGYLSKRGFLKDSVPVSEMTDEMG
jgi:uncharacterized Fe-S cluster-containing radical SAM superfamily protein